MRCEECGSEKITYYKQIRVDGVEVVTARCDNWHHPKRGKPFYPTYNFHMEELELLPEKNPQPKQLVFGQKQ